MFVTASDLHPVNPGNSMHKDADDTYLVVPAANNHSSVAEITHIEKWAEENNFVVNFKKSIEIPMCLREADEPSCYQRQQSQKLRDWN